MNWRRGVPDPETVKGVPFSAGRGDRVSVHLCGAAHSTGFSLRGSNGEDTRREEPRRTLGEVALVHQPRDDMRVLEVIVVVRSENVSRDRSSKVAAKLLVVGAVPNRQLEGEEGGREEGRRNWL